MSPWVSLALALIRLITQLISLSERNHWLNEGARREIARVVQENNLLLARALNVEKEVQELDEAELRQLIEEKGWYDS